MKIPARRGIYKSRAQLAAMRRPGEVTRLGLEAARATIRAGVSTLEVDAAAEAAIRAAGGVPNFALEPGYNHTTCIAVNDEVVHAIPGSRVLEPGDLVTVDCGALVEGWNGDAAFSMVVPGGSGEIVAVREALSVATEQAMWAGIAALASAKMLGEVGEAIEASLAVAGDYSISEDWIGHGIGKKMHEEPPVFNYAKRQRGPAVKPGLCIAVEPIVMTGRQETRVIHDGWTVVTEDGGQACQWEHSVAVHSDGIWVLTSADGGASALAQFGVTPVPIPER